MVIYFNKDNKQNGFFKVLGETVGPATTQDDVSGCCILDVTIK